MIAVCNSLRVHQELGGYCLLGISLIHGGLIFGRRKGLANTVFLGRERKRMGKEERRDYTIPSIGEVARLLLVKFSANAM
ncbi:hypothetical protein AB3S75_035287 [Citrus x aurantiifolia]